MIRSAEAVAGPVEGVAGAIGATPLVRMRRLLGSRPDLALYGKLERANPGGSVKDRPALEMLRAALGRGEIGVGSTVVESSSGNMGVGLAQACAYLGLNLICVVDDRAHGLNVRKLRALGADVRHVRVAGGADPLAARLELVARLVDEVPGAWRPDQYANPANPAAHAAGTMREIDEALGGGVDWLFVATSTAGTLGGCADYLGAHGRETRIVAVDAVGSVLFGGERASRRLPGMGAGVASKLSERARYDRLARVDDLACVIGCRRLARREGILAGASSGGVVAAIEAVAADLPRGSCCAAILPDGGEGYLETVFDDGWVERELGRDAARLDRLVAGDA